MVTVHEKLIELHYV